MSDCRFCREGNKCFHHSLVSEAIERKPDEFWYVIQRHLNSMPAVEREKARKLFLRRLKHFNDGVAGLGANVEPPSHRTAAKPQFDSPLCICGDQSKRHDEMTGECRDCACDMYSNLPS